MIDSHCHLYIDASPQKQDELVKEAVDGGVDTIICIGIDAETSRKSVELADRYESVYAAVGLHPHDASKYNEALIEELQKLAGHPKAVAIGECGLDYYRNLSPREIQKEAFRNQLELAADLKKPVIIHTRESLEDAMALVTEFKSNLIGGVFHCFPGNVQDAEKVFELGFHVSFGGVITFRNSSMSQVAGVVELDKVILETDAPYLTPEPFRGKFNRPAYVRYVYDKLAALRDSSFGEIERTIDRNCRKLFGLVETFEG